MIEHCVKSHIGQRELNEDNYLIDEEMGLYIVADGVGGLEKGEVASRLTCDLIQKNLLQGMSLVVSIEAAHKTIVNDLKLNNKNMGMASTVVVVKFDQNNYEIAWVGDSRVYLWDGELKLLTRDHSYLELLHSSGHIEIDDFNDNPNKNVILQAIGIENKPIEVATNKGTLEKNQILLMTTDGLYEVVKEQKVIEYLSENKSIRKMTQLMVNNAVKLGGKDNITLLMIKSNQSVNQEDFIKPDLVRKFDADTGMATELKQDIKKIPEEPDEGATKIILPKNLTDIDTKNNSKISSSKGATEIFLILSIIISIVIILALLM